MEEYEQAVFISYAWGGASEEIVNQLDQTLQQRGLKIIRDKRDLGYKGSIRTFMERIGQGNCVIVVISDKYLRSPNCMFELVEIAEGKQFHDRIFPIVLSDADIYDPVKWLQYVKHWEDKLAGLDQAMKEVGQANLQGAREEIDRYSRIRDKVSGLTSILKDMNTLTPDTHKDSDFSEIYTGIERRMSEASDRKTTLYIPTHELVRRYPPLTQKASACPYRSLDSFEEHDDNVFFGRDRVITKLLEKLNRQPRFLAVLGPSGSGKSSVVKAGLIPALRKGKVSGSRKWKILSIRPGLQPFLQLEAIGLTDAKLGLVSSVAKWLREELDVQRLVIFIDQFEELLVSTPEEIKQSFVAEIARLLDSSIPCTVILTLRDDFYSRFQLQAAPLVNWLDGCIVNISPTLEVYELRDIIIKPCEQVGIGFEDGLLERIIQDTIEIERAENSAQSTILPLLEFALTQMWEIRQKNILTHNEYKSIGGVAGGLSQWADRAYYNLDKDERFIARRVLTSLVNLGDDTQGIPNTKRFRSYSEIANDEISEIVVQKLVEARLLVTGIDASSKKAHVEIIHEALIYQWTQLSNWIVEDREFLEVYNQFVEDVWEWENGGHDRELLYKGGRLVRILQWLDNQHYDTQSVIERIFLEESKKQEAADLESARLVKATEARAILLEALNNVAIALASNLQREELISTLLSHLKTVIPYDSAVLWLREGNWLRVASAENVPGLENQHRIQSSLDDNVFFKEIVRSGHSLVISNQSQDPIFRSKVPQQLSWLGIPLIMKNEVMGILTLEKTEADFFTHEHVQIGSAFASQAAIAFENASLFEESANYARRLQAEIIMAKQAEAALGLWADQPLPQEARPIWLRYGLALAVTFIIVLLRQLLDPLLGTSVQYAPLLVAIAFSIWYGGVGPAILSLLLGYTGVTWLVLDWQILLAPTLLTVISLGLFLFSAIVIIALGEATRRAQRHAHQSARVAIERQKLAETRLAEQKRTEESMRQLNLELEDRVQSRTAQIQKEIDTLHEQLKRATM